MAADPMNGGTRRCRALVAAALVAVGLLATAVPAGAAPADSTQYVKYYTVTSSYHGAPENLSEISQRFLGTTTRSVEILDLNVGRTQPEGGTLTDANTLHPGWQLLLPWDAVGAGMQYGLLPDGATAPIPVPAPSAGATQAAQGESAANEALADEAGTRVKVNPPGNPAMVPTSPPKPPVAGGPCAAAATSNSPSNWAALRLAPNQAWTRSRGKGQLVAIVDSGADGSLPQLAGHTAIGADIVTGSGRGDTDCLGSGTAMAGIVAAQPTQGNTLSGIAPDATVLPVRIVTTTPKAQPANEAAGIDVAVSAGANVIALGSYVDVNDAAVAKAITDATGRDIVVVMPSPGASTPASSTAGGAASATLRVGGVGVDGQPAATYRPGAVDVVAPGLNVTTLGITGAGVLASNGTAYAVAFVAGEAALVRATYPGLSASQVVHRIEVTADKMSSSVPDSRYGYGMINPGTSVTRVLSEEQHAVAPAVRQRNAAGGASSAGRTAALAIVGLVGLAAVALLTLRVRRLVRPTVDQAPDGFPQLKPDQGRHRVSAGTARPGRATYPAAVSHGSRSETGTVSIAAPKREEMSTDGASERPVADPGREVAG